MISQPARSTIIALLMCCVGLLSNCGGGSNNTSQPPPPPTKRLSITTASILPGTLTNTPYNETLQAINGNGTLTWSIAPISSTTLFVDGLSINASTGVLSGNANWSGTAGFVATVSDSSNPPQTADQTFTITADGPLQQSPPQTFTIGQYQDIFVIQIQPQGGVQPFSFSLNGSLPFGLKFDSSSGRITGSTTVTGSFPFSVIIQDSFTPPEVVTAQVTIQVVPPQLSIANSVPQNILLNRVFSGSVIAKGGIPPYKFSLASGSLPPGLSSIDPSSGQFSGTPTTLGNYFFTVNVTDSSGTPQSTQASFPITVSTPLGRNDSPSTATPIGNGQFMASISPYIDPPDNAPLPNDNDYYKLVSLSGATVHVETFAQRFFSVNPLDTVIEIVDGNGNQQTACRQPGDTSSNFASLCVNDDNAPQNTTDSALDFQVPGPTNTATTFYVHVLDWRGDARPDMAYELEVSGLVAPMSIQTTSLLPAARGLAYSQQLSANNPIGSVSWILSSGALPPGISLNSSGALSGSATTDGTYSFKILATDSGNPPQTATAQYTIQVVDPVKITSPAVWPDACVNQPYTFAVQTSGGAPPFGWSFVSNGLWVTVGLDQSTGIFSGSPNATGTFFGTVGVFDATQTSASQNVTLTVKTCP